MESVFAGVDASAPEPAPEAAVSSFEETVLSLLTKLTADVAAQGERLDAVEKKNEPRFIDPRLDAANEAAQRSKRALSAAPDGIPHGMTIPTFPNGQQVPEMVMQQYRPRFGSGDLVQLDLDAVPHGRADGRTRGELMAEADVPNGYGEVFDRTFLSGKVGRGWKYRVNFDKAVMPGSNGGLTALYEWELKPA
jgi:hypothetical protein